MNLKKTIVGLTPALWMLAPLAQASPVVEIRQATASGNPSSDVGSTRIRVDGAGKERYDAVKTSTLDVWVAVRGKRPDGADDFKYLKIGVEGTTLNAPQPGNAWKNYKVSLPYRDPRSSSVANVRVSPVKRCNDHLATLTGAARQAALKEGFNILQRDAYSLRATATWTLHPGGSPGPFFEEPYHRDFNSEAHADAVLECLALDRPKPRTQTTTRGVDPRPGKRMEPTIKTAKLRIEPADIQVIDGQRCPMKLNLYGQITTIRAFQGSALFFGPYFLTPLMPLDFNAAGTRNIRATYPLRWSQGLALTSGTPAAARSQRLTLKMNVVSDDNQVLESVADDVRVTCERIPATPPAGKRAAH